jgi:hypothetical protein
MSIRSMIAMVGHTIDVMRPIVVVSGGGTRTVSGYSKVYANVSAWVQPATAAVIRYWMALQRAVTHSIYVDTLLDLHQGDVIVWRGNNYLFQGGPLNDCGLDRLWSIVVSG